MKSGSALFSQELLHIVLTQYDILFQLAVKSDILLENYIPGKLSEMGLGYEQLSKIAPELVYCSITGWLILSSELQIRRAFEENLKITFFISQNNTYIVTPH